MISRQKLATWILDALEELGPSQVADISKHMWDSHREEFAKAEASGEDLFYTWQYAMRWEGQKLQKQGKLHKKVKGRLWALA